MTAKLTFLSAIAITTLLLGATLLLHGQSDCLNMPGWCWNDYEINCMPTYSEYCEPDYCSMYMCRTCYDEVLCDVLWQDVLFCEAVNCVYEVCEGDCP